MNRKFCLKPMFAGSQYQTTLLSEMVGDYLVLSPTISAGGDRGQRLLKLNVSWGTSGLNSC